MYTNKDLGAYLVIELDLKTIPGPSPKIESESNYVCDMSRVFRESLTATGSFMPKWLKVTMFDVILSHLLNFTSALEVSWYIVYQSVLAIAQKS